jgi:SWI/SNF-related matrix-associated actin-dependent regulator 1 of chromatin subfamily A
MKLIKAEGTKKPWWILQTIYEERAYPKKAGFWWNTRVCPGSWATNDLEKAYLVREHADPELRKELEQEFGERVEKVEASKAADADIDIPRPEGLEYMPFQKAGIAYALDRPATLPTQWMCW